MGSPEFVDPYVDPDTGLLRNLVGAETGDALAAAEGALSFARLVQLMDHPPKRTGDLAELRAIHRHLFQDVYDWAGKNRTVDIRKNAEGAGFFLPASLIERAAGFAVDELREDNMLRGLGREKFIDRLAHHYDQINYLHPFREGNGRTQRVFWNRIARDAGWQLDWQQVHGDVNDRASRSASDQQDLGPLRDMLDHMTSKATPASGRDGRWSAAERARLGFPVASSGSVREDSADEYSSGMDF